MLFKELGKSLLSVGLFGLWQISEKKAWVMLFFSMAWSMWLLYNDVIFKQKIPNYDTLFFLIVTWLCLWLTAI
jgi:hypothetical protein